MDGLSRQRQQNNDHHSPRVLVAADPDLDPAHAASLHRLLTTIFSGAGLNPAEPACGRALVMIGEEVVASVAYRRRKWSLPGQQVEGALVAYLCSDPRYRGAGYALLALSTLMDAIVARGHGPTLLHCVWDLVPFYGRLGWRQLSPAAVYSEEDGSLRLDPDPVLSWDAGSGVDLTTWAVDPFPLGTDW